MRYLFFLCTGFILFLSSACNTKTAHIVFKAISDSEFNGPADSTFALPHGRVWDERKKIHDSCMGESFEPNAIFMRSKDSFILGCIVNKQTMKVVENIDPKAFPAQLGSATFVFTTKPCYDKRPIDIRIDSFMNSRIPLRIDTANEQVNNELMDAMLHSIGTEVETGSWITMELTAAWGKILDSTQNPILLGYKTELLKPDNMILVRSSGITDISFYFITKDVLPADLKNKLLTKPAAAGIPHVKAQFTLLTENSFKLSLSGFFQVIGQFMKCSEE